MAETNLFLCLRPGHRLLRHSLVALIAGFLAGCAWMPELESHAEMKPVEAYQGDQTLKGTQPGWPEDQWWEAYGDPQLATLIEEGLAGSPNMTIAEARLRRAVAMAGLAESALYPDVDANASVSMEKQSYKHIMGRNAKRGWRDYGQATLDFSWEIDFWGKNRAAYAAATSAAEAAEAERAEAELVLTTSIASEYGELARLFAAHDTVSAAVAVRSKNLTLFRNRFKEGMETMASVRQEEARLAAAEEELLELEEMISLQRNRLAALIGAGPDRGLSITRPSLKVKGFGIPEEMQLALLGRRPDIVAARKRVESSASTIEQRKAEFYPNVNLTAFIGFQSLGLNHLVSSGSDFGAAGPAISLPIFNGGRLRSQLFVAQAELEEAIGNYNLTVTEALQQVADAAASQQALGRQIVKINEAVDAAREAHRIVNNRYNGGLSNYIEVLAAEETLLTNMRAQSDLLSRSFTLDVALIKALGGGYTVPAENKE
ncbi:efflux transporter outer membrane subunit [Oxalobacter sp. OttesenSCG-928-P03]|nr:efflux transporter outer membrane subunit [Oxalobacter sp. OttesenSCG-928-P03]